MALADVENQKAQLWLRNIKGTMAFGGVTGNCGELGGRKDVIETSAFNSTAETVTPESA
jgi:hypothetical protein